MTHQESFITTLTSYIIMPGLVGIGVYAFIINIVMPENKQLSLNIGECFTYNYEITDNLDRFKVVNKGTEDYVVTVPYYSSTIEEVIPFIEITKNKYIKIECINQE